MNTKKLSAAILLWSLVVVAAFSLLGCTTCPPGDDGYAESERISRYFIQGNISAGTIQLNRHNTSRTLSAASAGSSGFAADADYFATLPATSDIALAAEAERSSVSPDMLNALREKIAQDVIAQTLPAAKEPIRISADFTGSISLFPVMEYSIPINGQYAKLSNTVGGFDERGLFVCGGKETYYSGNQSSLTSTYGTELSERLQAQTPAVKYFDTSQKFPVGPSNKIFLTSSSWNFSEINPDAVRGLMTAAQTVNDPRLLVIERASTADNLKITAFGAVAFDAPMPASGHEFTWDFSGDNLQKAIALLGVFSTSD